MRGLGVLRLVLRRRGLGTRTEERRLELTARKQTQAHQHRNRTSHLRKWGAHSPQSPQS